MDRQIKLILSSRTGDRDSAISPTMNPIFSKNDSSVDDSNNIDTRDSRSSYSLRISKVCLDKVNEKELLNYSSNNCPNYYTLSVWVYDDLVVKYQVENSIMKILLSVLSFTIVGHLMTDIGRYSWLVVIWKIVIMVTVSLGYWNDYLVDVFRADSTINDIINHIKDRDEFGTMLQGVLSIRSILFQLVPPFTFLSLYVQATSSCPIFVPTSSKISSLLLPLILTWKDARNMALQEELLPENWVVFLLSLHFFVCGGRLIRYIVEVSKLVLPMSVIFLSIDSNTNSVKSISLVVIITSVFIVPYTFFSTLKYIVLLGKSPLFHMTDNDFKDLFFIQEMISRYFGTPDHHEDDDIDKDDMKDVDNRITLTHFTNSNRVDDRFRSNRLDDTIHSNRIDDPNNDTSNSTVTSIIHTSSKWIERTVTSLPYKPDTELMSISSNSKRDDND